MHLNLLKHLLGSNQRTLKQTLRNFLITKGYKVIEKNGFLYAEGNIPVCLVAHLDTVFKTEPENIYYDKEQQVLWSPQGLGADDRAGVYAILDIVHNEYKPTILFCEDEEAGGIGAQKAISFFKDAPTELKMIIELDRQGQKDCVFYDCDNEPFVEYIEKFGFQMDYGSFSDISFIAPAWGVAAVNVSVGYVNEHTKCELLHIDWLEDTIAKIKNLLDKIDEAPSFAYIPMEWQCAICKNPLNEKNASFIKFGMNYFDICKTCRKQYYTNYDNGLFDF